MRDINDHLINAHPLDNYFSFESMEIEKIEIYDDVIRASVRKLSILPGFPNCEYPTWHNKCTIIYEGVKAIGCLLGKSLIEKTTPLPRISEKRG